MDGLLLISPLRFDVVSLDDFCIKFPGFQSLSLLDEPYGVVDEAGCEFHGHWINDLELGVVEAFGTIYLGDFLDRDAIAFAFLIFVLMLRPQGLFSGR